jgi:hypothetical protein
VHFHTIPCSLEQLFIELEAPLRVNDNTFHCFPPRLLFEIELPYYTHK